MAFSTTVKHTLNRILACANLRLDTLTEQSAQDRHLEKLKSSGHFERPIFAVPKSFETANVSRILEALPQFRPRFDTFCDATKNDVGYSFTNDYFHSPDAEAFYTLIRLKKPGQIFEIGSGNSTRIARQAILDGELNTRLISIDPQPRSEIDSLADECLRQPVEEVAPAFFDALNAGDFLFIDSSHEIRIGNDGAFLYGVVLPRIAPGVIIHIHDIFLPYEYPADWIVNRHWDWNEQYLVQAALICGNRFHAIWPGYYLQRTLLNFHRFFPNLGAKSGRSLWLAAATE